MPPQARGPGAGQQKLAGADAPVVTWRDDFVGLFGDGRIMPTSLRVLEQGEHLLFIHHFEWNSDITRKQDQIYQLLVRYGAGTEAPGTITVVCVWGLANTHREVLVYDPYRGKLPRQAATNEELREILVDWWLTHKRRRR